MRRHPVSGAPGLFVNEGFTTRILGVTAKESDAVLRFLFEHVTRPDFVVRWRWSEGDVAFWDNRLTQHYACANICRIAASCTGRPSSALGQDSARTGDGPTAPPR